MTDRAGIRTFGYVAVKPLVHGDRVKKDGERARGQPEGEFAHEVGSCLSHLAKSPWERMVPRCPTSTSRLRTGGPSLHRPQQHMRTHNPLPAGCRTLGIALCLSGIQSRRSARVLQRALVTTTCDEIRMCVETVELFRSSTHSSYTRERTDVPRRGNYKYIYMYACVCL